MRRSGLPGVLSCGRFRPKSPVPIDKHGTRLPTTKGIVAHAFGCVKPKAAEELKAVGCMWHAKRVAWYWRPEEQKAYRRSRSDLAGLAAQYGCKMFHATDKETAIAA